MTLVPFEGEKCSEKGWDEDRHTDIGIQKGCKKILIRAG